MYNILIYGGFMMKKKIFNIFAMFALVLITSFSLVACGKSSKIKITLSEFDDEFISQVCISGIPNGTSSSEDFDTKIERQFGVLYSMNNYHQGITTTDIAEFAQGKWDVCIEIALDTNGNVDDLKVEVNGQEFELIDSMSPYGETLAPFYGYTPGQWRYYAVIENISADTQIKFIGHVQAVNS